MKLRLIQIGLLMVFAISIPSCRTEYRSQPYFDKLKAEIDAGQPPDVGYMDALRVPDYINQGRLRALDGLIDKDELNDFYPSLLRYFQRDGKTYSLPRDFQTVALLVNKDLFAKKGLVDGNGNAKAPGSWDEFREFAEKLTDKPNGISGVGLTPGFWNWLPFLFQAGGSVLDESGTKMTLDTENANVALTFYTNLYKDGFAFLSEGTWPYLGAHDTLLDAFAAGKVGMILGGNSMYSALKDRGAPVQVVELPPGAGGKATIPYVVGYGLFSDAGARPGPALDLLRFAVSQEGIRIWVDSAAPLYMPARISMRDEWGQKHADAVAFMAGVDYLRSYQPKTASAEAVAKFDTQAAPIMARALRGEVSVKDALAELQKIGAELLKE